MSKDPTNNIKVLKVPATIEGDPIPPGAFRRVRSEPLKKLEKNEIEKKKMQIGRRDASHCGCWLLNTSAYRGQFG